MFGRTFTADDIEQQTRGLLVSAAFATRAFGVRNAVGEVLRLRTPDEDLDFRVLGVVDDVRHEGRLHGGAESIYMHTGVVRRRTMKFFVRSDRPADDVMQAITATVGRVDPLLPVSDLAPLDQTLEADVARPRLAARLIGGFSIMALALAALGLYGTLAYATVVRRRELGVRLAIGATPRALLLQVLHEGLWLTGIGVVLGAASVLVLLQAARHVLFGIGTVEPGVLAAAATLTLLVSVAASLAPAWRAATVDALTALRSE